MTNIQRKSNKVRNRRNKIQKRVEALRHRSKFLNNQLLSTGLSRPANIKQPNPEISESKFIRAFPELKQVFEDHTFIIEHSLDGKEMLLFNSESDFICSIPYVYVNSFLGKNKAKTV